MKKRAKKKSYTIDRKKWKLYFRKKCRSLKTEKVKTAIEWGTEIIVVCILAWMLVSFFGQRVSNAGDSMSPVLKNGDVVLINRIVYDARKPKRGEIIAFRPNGNENAHYCIKRVVGLPGETVQIKDGKIYIDGKVQKKNVYTSDLDFAGIAEKKLTLGETEYFVLGDNSAGSDDSRLADIGNVKREDIGGKVWFVTNIGKNFGFVK
ncbi:signal peptidase I [Firmicutes bacterium AM41-5BH]|jgi:signal peptidase I|uniref:Signal peptidase I n=1 Tax=Ruminococcus hominis TaxID=2763065 RepID=A0ABR7G8T1_9FIRM|nr:signal peptidase I [Ruminococcus hominis]MBC5683852.1 signal peptidase I [Ruminococcus hominis]RGH40848.1 signal peptidase I [Firmicutes bacterium AM41-5BH]